MILGYIDQHGKISRGEAMELCNLTRSQAYKLLKKMCRDRLERMGNKKGAVYLRKHSLEPTAPGGA
jgi:ATP-dependent DNA helicase RecG